MPRHFAIRALLSVVVIGMTVFGCITTLAGFQALPFIVNISNSHHATLEPIKGIALPPGVVAGDRLDPSLQSRRTRIAIMSSILTSGEPKGATYDFVISRGSGPVTVPVATVNLYQSPQVRLHMWITLLFNITLTGLTLPILWRGRDRVALGLAIWTVCYVIANAGYASTIPRFNCGTAL